MKPKKRGLKIAGIVCTLLVVASCISVYISYNVLTVTEYKLKNKKVQSPMRMLLVSDLHNHQFGDNNEELIKKMLDLQPDAIFMDGDMLNVDTADCSWLFQLIRSLSSEVPVYFAYGNHEIAYQEQHPELREQLTEAGAVVVEENYVDTTINGNAVRIGGFYDYAFSMTHPSTRQDTMDSEKYDFLDDFCSSDALKIMLSHRPDSFVFSDASSVWSIDYVLCGHNHGGQVILPFIGGLFGGDQGFLPEYASGIHQFTSMQMIITRGLSSNPEYLPRFNNPPEIVCLDFVSSNTQE